MPYRAAPLADEDATERRDCVEVTARWGDELLAVVHLRPGERLTLGTLALPAVDDRWVLAEHTADGRAVAHRHPQSEGDAGRTLARGESHAQTLGAVTLVVQRTWGMDPAARRQVEPRTRVVLAMAGVLLATAAVGVTGLRGAPAAREQTVLDEGEDDRRVLQALVARWPDTTRAEPRVDRDVAPVPAWAAPVERPRPRRYAVKVRDEAPHVARQVAIEQVQSRGIFSALGPMDGAGRRWPPDFAPWGCFTRVGRRWRLDGELMTEVSEHSSPRWLGWHVQFTARVRADGRVDQVALSRGLRHEGELRRAMGRARLDPARRDRISVCCIDRSCEDLD